MELHAQYAHMDAQGASQDQAIELASDNSSLSDFEPVQTVQTPPEPFSSTNIPNGVPSADSLLKLGEALQPESVRKRGIAVVVYPVERASEYRLYGGPAVSEIVERYDDGGLIEYLVRYEDDSEEVVSRGNFLLILELSIILGSSQTNAASICQTSTQPSQRVAHNTAKDFQPLCLCCPRNLAGLTSPSIHFWRFDDYSMPYYKTITAHRLSPLFALVLAATSFVCP